MGNAEACNKFVEEAFGDDAHLLHQKLQDQQYLQDLASAIYYCSIEAEQKKYILRALTHYCKKSDPSYDEEIAILMDTNRPLTARELDCLWLNYYLTGDKRFAFRVKAEGEKAKTFEISNGVKVYRFDFNSSPVIASAIWSYKSHLETGRLTE